MGIRVKWVGGYPLIYVLKMGFWLKCGIPTGSDILEKPARFAWRAFRVLWVVTWETPPSLFARGYSPRHLWQAGGKSSAYTWGAEDHDMAAVVLCDGIRNRQYEAGALFQLFGDKERFADVRQSHFQTDVF